MTFIAALVAIVVDRLYSPLDRLRDTAWFSGCFHFMGLRIMGINMFNGTLGAVVAVLAPVVVVAIAMLLLAEAGQVFEFVAGIAILAFMLGPRALHAELEAYVAATEAGDEEQAQAIADRMLHGSAPGKRGERCTAVMRAALTQANDRVFAVVFWFVILGPLGAVFFRAAEILSHKLAREFGDNSEFAAAAARMHGILAWLPARLLAASYAFAGSFEDAIADWRTYYAGCSASFFEINNEVLGCAGAGAVRLSAAGSNEEITYLRAVDNLVFRAEILWLVVIGVVTITGLV